MCKSISVFLIIVSCLCANLQAQSTLVFSDIDSRNGLSDNRIRNIAQLTDGRLMVVTEGIVNIYDGTAFKHLHKKAGNFMLLPGYFGLHHSYVEGNKIWIKNYQRLMLIDASSESYVEHPDSVLRSMGISEHAADLFVDTHKNYWIKTVTDNLLLHSASNHKTRLFLKRVSFPQNIKDELYDIAVVGNDVFLFYQSGLMLSYDLRSARKLYQTNTLNAQEQLLYNRTLMVVQDGDYLYTLRNNQKGVMQAYNTKKRTWSTILKTDYWLNTISTDNKNNIWVSCKNGLWQISKDFSKKELINTFRLVDGTDVTTEASTLFNDNQGGFWIGTFNHGLLYYHPDRFKFRNVGKFFFKNSGNDIEINGFSEPTAGQILVGTNKGVFKYDTHSAELEPALRELHIRACYSITRQGYKTILQTDKGNFVLENNKIRKDDRSYENLRKKTIASLPEQWRKENDLIYTDVLKDSRGFVWIGTPDGLIRWDSEKNLINTFYSENGLINNSVKAILEDKNRNIWVSTSGGVSRISISMKNGQPEFQTANYNRFDGVIENEFIEQSIFLSSNEFLFLGGVNGMNIIDLKQPWAFRRLNKPLFTSLSLFGTSVNQGEQYKGKQILKRSITTTDSIELNFNQNFISIGFSALNYVNPSQTYYRYRLEGIDNDWREIASTDGSGSASYTNLAPGTYELQVKAANSSKEWSTDTARMTIIIYPPFWKTAWAYLIYMVLSVFLLYWFLAYYRKRTHKMLAQKNAEKLNQMKFRFFTNISHEFRTPLTLIITPLESILKEFKGSASENKLQSVYRNAQELLNLVNQLLDFRRLEVSGEKLHLTFGNLSGFISQFEDLFSRLAAEKNIRFQVECKPAELYLFFDNRKLYKIVNNLLSNAFKFTPEGGEIRLELIQEGDKVLIKVSDNGQGISENEQARIFDRFYQTSGVEGGSGIGLHLVKEYTELHQGSVAVESVPKVKTVFTVSFPVNLAPENGNTEQQPELLAETSEQMLLPVSSHKLLIVEDNEELRRFLVSELCKFYLITEAKDGVEGLEKAQKELPDLIISDVLMPRMDGLELCRKIKSDVTTSHIPVILLTARASEEHRVSGYESGADEYLAKPFSLDILLLRISNLIKNQQRRQQEFFEKIEVNPREITITSLDEQLIQRALTLIEDNMDNCDYTVQQLSNDLNMDRTVLYKKLQSITGLAPLEFIRSIRLKRAAQLLVQGQYPVTEVAEMVGFNTQKYFSRYFKEAFGVNPSQYAQRQNKQ